MLKTSTDALRATPAHLRRCDVFGDAMGGRFSARFYAPRGIDIASIETDLVAVVEAVENQMSNWRPQSHLSRLNAAELGEWIALPCELIDVLNIALQIGDASLGAFDIAVGELVSAWGFGPPDRKPDPPRIRTLTGAPHISANCALNLDVSGQRACRRANVSFDLSGIAKGFGVDQLARCLDHWGVADYLVGIDGEMRAHGRKPNNQPWTIAIDGPDSKSATPMGALELADGAIATSGDYRNRIVVGDQRLSHTMHPQLARPVQNGVASVSVVAETCVHADAWATALMVLGPEVGAALARNRKMNVLFVLRENGAFRPVCVGLFE